MKHLFKKGFSREGMALLTVLSVMVILLILSLAIVSLSTGNLTTMGSINARLQALILANSASMYAIYELESQTDPNISWSPGFMPTPATGLSFVTSTWSPIANTNGLPGICRVACINNLGNPNSITVVGGPSFYPSLTSTEVYGETAVIVGQGEYSGFKRTIKITVKYTNFGSGGDGIITLDGGNLLVNGISNIRTLEPGAGWLYGGAGINYSNIDSFRFYNGSTLRSNKPIMKTGGGVDIDQRFLEPNQPEQTIPDWNLGDSRVTGGDPNDPNCYIPVAYGTESSGLDPNSIARPSFPSLSSAIDDTERYLYTCDADAMTFIDQNIFVNGSLHIAEGSGYDGDLVLYNSNLFINGVLIIDGCLNGDNSNIFVSGYVNDTTPPDPNQPYGFSMIIKEQNDSIDPNRLTGVGIFTEGDIKINNVLSSVGGDVDDWIRAAPLDTEKIRDTFNMLGMSGASGNDTWDWYTNAYVDHPPLIYWDDAIENMWGCAECYQNLVENGLKPVPDEVADWFNRSDSHKGMKWATGHAGGEEYHWDGFKLNPTLYTSSDVAFFQGLIFTHGTYSTEGTLAPVAVIGSVISKNHPAGSPSVSPSGHGGNMYLSHCSSVFYCPEYLKARSGQIVIKPVLTVYAWQEL